MPPLVSVSRAHAEAVKLLKGIKPTSRQKVFQEVADNLHRHPMLVEFFRARMEDPHNTKGGLYHPEDAFGDAFWDWKGWHDIDEGWEDLSRDEAFRKVLEGAVRTAVAAGLPDLSREDTRDYFTVGLRAAALWEAIQQLDRGIPTEAGRRKAMGILQEITQMLQ